MHVHWLQHVPFEGLGSIASWLQARNAKITQSRLWTNDPLPQPQDLDMLVAMGGPMGIYDTDSCPWLTAEITFIADVIKADKPVLGICLGSQLLSAALGARVYPGTHKEIGWYEIRKNTALQGHWLDEVFPERFEPLHWHGDTFDLPAGARQIGSSDAYECQGFVLGDKVVALQFHLEMQAGDVARIVENCADELVSAPYIQSQQQILSASRSYPQTNKMMASILNGLERLR